MLIANLRLTLFNHSHLQELNNTHIYFVNSFKNTLVKVFKLITQNKSN